MNALVVWGTLSSQQLFFILPSGRGPFFPGGPNLDHTVTQGLSHVRASHGPTPLASDWFKCRQGKKSQPIGHRKTFT